MVHIACCVVHAHAESAAMPSWSMSSVFSLAKNVNASSVRSTVARAAFTGDGTAQGIHSESAVACCMRVRWILHERPRKAHWCSLSAPSAADGWLRAVSQTFATLRTGMLTQHGRRRDSWREEGSGFLTEVGVEERWLVHRPPLHHTPAPEGSQHRTNPIRLIRTVIAASTVNDADRC